MGPPLSRRSLASRAEKDASRIDEVMRIARVPPRPGWRNQRIRSRAQTVVRRRRSVRLSAICERPKANPHSSERPIHASECNAGDPLACFHLGQIEYESGNVGRATDLTATACDAGIVGACTLFGVISYEEGSPGRRPLLISEACTAGDVYACDFERTVRERSEWETCASDLVSSHRTRCYPECLFPRDYRPLATVVAAQCGTMDARRDGDTPLVDQWTKAWANERRRSPFRAHPLPIRLPKPDD